MVSANFITQILMSSAAVSAAASSSRLFASSYAGNVSSLALSRDGKGAFGLTITAASTGCGPNPSWLTIDTKNQVLYCLNEGLDTPNGSLSTMLIQPSGELKNVKNVTSFSGPVSGAIFNGGKNIALAHYSGSAVSSWKIKDTKGDIELIQGLTYKLSKPGPVPDRQDAPHEHEAIVDPTGKYLLVPDLGADLVRVFSYDSNGALQPQAPLNAVAGSGPRHATFYLPDGQPGGTTFLHLVGELGNNVTSYAVTYKPNNGGLDFKMVSNRPVYGDKPAPKGIATAEVAVSPDNRFLVISNRNDSSFQLANPDPKNSTKIPSDSISTFSLNKNGTLSFVQLAPAGGVYPRQFAINPTGDLVAVGLQLDNTVLILSRDVKTGYVGNVVARQPLTGQVTCVRWADKTFDGTYANA